LLETFDHPDLVGLALTIVSLVSDDTRMSLRVATRRAAAVFWCGSGL
jgi:hypothetical protein